MQQQNFSLAALAKRDADDPFSKPAAAAARARRRSPRRTRTTTADEAKFFETLDKALAGLSYAA